jgi:hypothetical protein
MVQIWGHDGPSARTGPMTLPVLALGQCTLATATTAVTAMVMVATVAAAVAASAWRSAS